MFSMFPENSSFFRSAIFWSSRLDPSFFFCPPSIECALKRWSRMMASALCAFNSLELHEML